MAETAPAQPPRKTPKVPHLLTLPQEIRDTIIEYVIASPSPRPDDLDTNKFQYTTAIVNERPTVLLPHYQTRNLLLTCRTLNLDALAASSRLVLSPTIMTDCNNHKLYWGHFPYIKPGFSETEKVLERVDLMLNAQVHLTPPYNHLASGGNVFTLEDSLRRTLEQLVMHGFDIHKGASEGHRRKHYGCGQPSCYIRCSIRDLHVYLPSGPGLGEYLESGLQTSVFEEFAWACGDKEHSQPLGVERLSFWQENKLIRHYDLSRLQTGMIGSEDWLQKCRTDTGRKRKLQDMAS